LPVLVPGGIVEEASRHLSKGTPMTKRSGWKVLATIAAVAVAAAGLAARFFYGHGTAASAEIDSAGASATGTSAPVAANSKAPTLELSAPQLQLLSISNVSSHSFPLQRRAVGSIDFNEDMETEIFPPYQGRIVELFARLGDNVSKGQTLFTIESPDLIQAESALIAAAGVLDLTSKALERARQLHELQGIADKDYEQTISDQQTAEGALKAGRDAVAVFGKTAAEIDHVLQTRTIDPYLAARSPVSGRITARNAAPGVFVQPGNLPAPYAVADISRLWMNANVAESDMPLIQKGQVVHVSIMAFPGRVFEGSVSALGATVDPQLHRGMVRAEIQDPRHELLPGMLASFLIVTGDPIESPAVPLDSVVREGDGSMTIWVTKDRRRFTQRTIRIGLQSDGYDQIVEGVDPGEQVVTRGAVFLDNMINGGET
jgi:cobalt-zinc-cadmium efflux system membrane fusion protein